MRIRIVFTDTGTGETDKFDTEVDAILPSTITKALIERWMVSFAMPLPTLSCVALEAERPVDVLRTFNLTPKVYGFIFRWTDEHFGYQLITGHIYTEFA